MPYKSPLAARVIELRAQNGWSQLDLAAVSEVGASTIERLERGKRVSFEVMRALANAFEVPPETLFALQEPALEKLLPITSPVDLTQILGSGRNSVLSYDEPSTDEEGQMLDSLQSDFYAALDMWERLEPPDRRAVTEAFGEHLARLSSAGWALASERVAGVPGAVRLHVERERRRNRLH